MPKIRPSTIVTASLLLASVIAINILNAHHITHVPLPVKIAWVERLNGDTPAPTYTPVKPQAPVYPGWISYVDPDNEFRLLIPPSWQVTSQNTVATHLTAQYGDVLRRVTFGPSADKPLVTIEADHAYPNTSRSVAVSEDIHWQYISGESTDIGGVAAMHEQYADGANQYDTYTIWYTDLILHALFLKQPSTDAVNEQFLFKKVAQSICFAPQYGSGECATR